MTCVWKDGGWGRHGNAGGWFCRSYVTYTVYDDYVDFLVDTYIRSDCRIDYNYVHAWVAKDNGGFEYKAIGPHKHPNGGIHESKITWHTYRVYREHRKQTVRFWSKVELYVLAGTSSVYQDIEVPAKVVPTPSVSSVTVVEGRYADISINLNAPGVTYLVIEREDASGNKVRVYTSTTPVSQYRDTLPGAGSYKYRVYTGIQEAYSEWSSWSRTVTALSVPSGPRISHVERVNTTSTRLTIDVNSPATQTLEIQRQKSGQTGETRIYASSPVSSYTDNPGAGTFRYRARNKNVAGESAWSEWSSWIATLLAPNAPTITGPASSATVSSTSPISITWRHNPKDGTAQTSAQIKVVGSKSGERTITSNSSTQSYQLGGMTANQTISIQVRTKGTHASYSPWSELREFRYLAPINASIQPIGQVKNFPFTISWAYEDGFGEQQDAVLELRDPKRVKVYSKTVTSAKSVTLSKGDFAIKDNTAYSVELRVRSTSSLTATARTSFRTKLVVPGVPGVSLHEDAERGSVSIVAQATTGDVATHHFNIRRDSKLIASNLSSGVAVVDIAPPLDCDVTYSVEAVSDLGTARAATKSLQVRSRGFAFINFGKDYESVARMAMNLQVNERVELEKTVMVTPSRRLPVVMYGESEQVHGSLSANAWWLKDLSQEGHNAMLHRFEQLARHKGVCLLRLPHRAPKYVSVDVKTKLGGSYNLAGIDIEYIEVDNYGLD